MLNKAILMGRLTRDPEKRYTQSNQSVTRFTLAIDRGRPGPNGERQADFIDCTTWGRQADFVSQWFTKGMLAIVVGRMQSSSYEDKNGNKRTRITVNCDEIQFGETKKSSEAHRREAAQDFTRPSPGDRDWSELPDDEGDVPWMT